MEVFLLKSLLPDQYSCRKKRMGNRKKRKRWDRLASSRCDLHKKREKVGGWNIQLKRSVRIIWSGIHCRTMFGSRDDASGQGSTNGRFEISTLRLVATILLEFCP